ncbi:beta-lactamase family protein [Bacillus cereus]|uniref:serine hydrolase n=1 Tax=Bacillus cereus TaxID=1396 RepID=UPI0012467772|nr:beta-lactamase family protein [Bacillus cereus]MCU5475466.1 beta-lactamase family protein [Bacillus cereus]MCU5614901.1 beta-lactamase family protein [Bacillus cereus]
MNNCKFELDIVERMDYYQVPGVSIAELGEQGIERTGYYGVLEKGKDSRVNKDSLFHACSMSKMVTSLGVLRLVQEGVVDLNEDVNKYLTSWKVPENAYTKEKKVTLANLLAHQGGFVDPEDSFGQFEIGDSIPTMKDILLGKTKFNPKPLQAEYVPGSQFSYSDAGFCIIEQLIEDVTNTCFVTVMNRLIIQPLGLKKTFFWDYQIENGSLREGVKNIAGIGHDKNGCIVKGKRAFYPYLASTGLWSTPTELSLIVLEIISAWNGIDTGILSPENARLMLKGHGCNEAVGLGVFTSSDGGRMNLISKGWGIGFQCMLVAYPEQGRGIIIMTNSDPGKPQNESLIGEIIKEYEKGTY